MQCSAAAIATDTRQLYRCITDIRAPISHADQLDGGQWVVGRILEGAALEDKAVYKQMLSKWRSTAMDQGMFHQFEEVIVLSL